MFAKFFMKNRLYLLLPLLLVALGSAAQPMTAAEYIAKYKDLAILEMRREGVPAAISLAQGLLETENGNSDLVKESNNHFGIKCKDNWTQASVTHDDDAPGECFRAYKSAVDSYRDHSDFLRNSDRYASLFMLNPRNYRAWAHGLRRAGYATNPKYAYILIKNIEDNHLEQYTDEAIQEGPLTDPAAIAAAYDRVSQELQVDTTQAVTAFAPAIKSSTAGPAPALMHDNEVAPQSSDPLPALPLGLTSINRCKVTWVLKGTSLLAVATAHHIHLGKLLQYNDLVDDGILDRDQYIYLERKQKTGDRDFCIASANESLRDIAQRNGIQLESLCQYNQMTAYQALSPGQRIWLRPSTDQPAASASTDAHPSGVIYHEVQPQENIRVIAREYHVAVSELKRWNHLKHNRLKTGQQLIVSK
ncbi:MAG: glucosaminidase domain-containing protein [Bacteroidota bacterium]|nr:glucosaminidase domain-containing protein [Bacteroidota bacterium]